MFYTYAHYKPQGGLFYIGKGSQDRAYIMYGRNPRWNNVVNKYGKPHVEILADWETEKEALDHEALLIECFRDMGFEIANIANGGQGTAGFSHPAWNKGIPISEEQRIKLRNAKLGTIGNRKGKKNSPEHRAKIKAGKASAPKPILSEAGRNKIILAVRGYKHIQATCIHCRTTGGVTGMARWHFDNCRLKETT